MTFGMSSMRHRIRFFIIDGKKRKRAEEFRAFRCNKVSAAIISQPRP
jgi:hypothetical protein